MWLRIGHLLTLQHYGYTVQSEASLQLNKWYPHREESLTQSSLKTLSPVFRIILERASSINNILTCLYFFVLLHRTFFMDSTSFSSNSLFVHSLVLSNNSLIYYVCAVLYKDGYCTMSFVCKPVSSKHSQIFRP